jgi:hypothetical protein
MVNRSMKTCRMNDGDPCAEEPYELAVGQATALPPPPGMVYVPASEFIMGSSDAEVDVIVQGVVPWQISNKGLTFL